MSIVEEAVIPVLIDQAAQPVLVIRKRTSMDMLKKTIGESYLKIMNYLEELGETPIDAPYTAYFNLDMSDLDVEMGFPVSRSLPERGEIKARIIPQCKAVSVMYKGAYSEMGSVYDQMLKWIEENGYEATGVYYEYYYNAPNEVPESELLTKIVIPII
ncbi:GyrI-like domain-containing protein [Bacillus massilinigeriensis]|uniref:GyrI-like domain-containing protein n=1 Tax=Bacillus massilionigeriensis TaxID=1805475 RepID=UPI00096AE650|nr:GyrI-like domain-containing protein [Bacillus massilionigeriensis]